MHKNEVKKCTSRALSRAVKARQAPTYNHLPLNAIVCGIDSAKVSGFSIWAKGNPTLSMSVATAQWRYDCVQMAYAKSLGTCLPLVFVFEDWKTFYTPKKNKNGRQRELSNNTKLALGEYRGMWIQEIHKLPVPYNLPITKILKVDFNEWRKPYGLNGLKRDDAKRAAIAIAEKIMGREMEDDNEAEAVLIGKYGCYNIDVKGIDRYKGY